ncbi:PREDICTED: organic cation transporter protein-like, partial [Priapulus caudatus]|uniref:Organic cation transporter protein-like n=1 Tax=Priapulus caudatus TaxID=37621 RepID=A0ABM1F4J3_PRICU
GASLTAYCLLCEYFPTAQRAFAGNAIYFAWSVGLMSLPGLAYVVQDWRMLHLIISVPMLLSLAMYWTMPESLHWLITHDRAGEAEAILETARRVNGATLPPHSLTLIPSSAPSSPCCRIDGGGSGEKRERKKTFLDVLRTPNLRVHALLCCALWAINGMVYYGLSLGTHVLAGNKHLNFFWSAVVEVPAYVACIVLLKRFGRKKPSCAFYVIAGLPLILVPFLPKSTASGTDLSNLVTLLTMIGKFGVTASFSAIYLVASELYPTVVRNSGLGMSCLSARIGAVLAPYTINLRDIHPAFQNLLFAVVAAAGALMVMVLPETARRLLPETLSDCEGDLDPPSDDLDTSAKDVTSAQARLVCDAATRNGVPPGGVDGVTVKGKNGVAVASQREECSV